MPRQPEEFPCSIPPNSRSSNAGRLSTRNGCSSILPTPNGVKVSIMLEEIGLPYEAHLIDIGNNETGRRNFWR